MLLGRPQTWDLIPAVLLTACQVLGESLNFTMMVLSFFVYKMSEFPRDLSGPFQLQSLTVSALKLLAPSHVE